jgi:flagellar biosynthesis GTPase FlhF
MSSPYREPATSAIECPRCRKVTASGEIVACLDRCGVWVTSEAAHTAFEASELKPSRIATWFRTRVGCPLCGKRMTLRGHDMSLFQGCDAHGFWVDESTITQTGLGRTTMAPRMAEARAAAKRIVNELTRPEREASERERVLAAEEQAREIALAAEEEAKREAEAKRARDAAELQRQLAAEAAERERVRLAEELERQRQRAIAEAEALRARTIERVNAAIKSGDSAPIVDELLRLDAIVKELAARVTDLERK